MKKLILLYLVVLLSTELYSQNIVISGYVRDSLSSEALIGVNVGTTSTRLSTSPSSWTTTNNYGFYSISCKKADTISLEFHYMGYNIVSKKITRPDSFDLDIQMKGLVTDISEAVVTGSRPAISSVEPLGKLSVNSSQLKYIPSFMGEQDVFKYLQLLPGVSAGKEASTGLNVRGGSSDQTLILLDDIPIYNHSHAFGFVSVFSGETIKSAELYKGYIPPSYGGRLSGVATMVMRDGNRNEHKQTLQLGTTTISGTVEGPINKGRGSYLVNTRLFTLGALLRLQESLAPQSALPYFGFYDFTAKANYDLNKNNTLYLSFYTGADELSFNRKISGNENEDSENASSGSSDVETIVKMKDALSWGNLGSSLRLSSKLSSKSFLNATLYYSYLYNDKEINYSKEEDGVFKDNEESKVFSGMHEIGVKTLLDQNISNWYKLSYGFNIAYQSFIPMSTYALQNGVEREDQYDNRGLFSSIFFLNNNFKFGNFGLNLGGRLGVYYNLREVVIKAEPRVSLSYNMKKSSVWVSYVENTQPLFSMNQYSYSLPIDYWIPFTEKDIIPTSKQFSLGYKQKIGDVLEIYTEVYYKKSKDISLIYNVDEFLLYSGGYDVAKNESYGFELMVQYQKNRFGFMSSYTYSNSQYNVDDKWFPFMYDTPHNLNLFGTYDVLRQQGRTHTISCNINYKTGLPYIFANEIYSQSNGVNSNYWGEGGVVISNPLYSNSRLKNYFRIDVSYSMEKKLQRGSRIWQISILNVTWNKNPYLVYADKNLNYGEEEYKYTGFTLIPFLPSFSYKRVF